MDIRANMTGVEQLAAILEHVEYKPGWRFRLVPRIDIHDPANVGRALEIQALVTDALSKREITIVHRSACPGDWYTHPVSDQEKLVRFVEMAIEKLEAHERDEWLRVGGRLVRDPHPGPEYQPYYKGGYTLRAEDGGTYRVTWNTLGHVDTRRVDMNETIKWEGE
jgi:hypothetical protein